MADTMIIEYKRTLSDVLCEDIIDKFEENFAENSVVGNSAELFIIPKNCVEWRKIETVLYKELLIKINEYKNNIINGNLCDETNELLLLLNKTLFIKDFIIRKYLAGGGGGDGASAAFKLSRTNNRYNVLTFVYFLNDCDGGGGELVFENDIKIAAKVGKLLIFPENREHHNKLYVPADGFQYIISGQLCYENIIL